MIRKVTHISQSQHDLEWISAPVADDFVKTGFGLSDLEAAGSAGVFNPDYGHTPYIQNQYDQNTNTVSIQMLWPSTEGHWLTSMCCRTPTLLGSRRRPVGRTRPRFQLVLMLPKALTDSDTIASPTSDVSWDGNLLLPTPPAPVPQHGSGTHPVTAVSLTSFLSQDPFAHSFAAAAPPPRSDTEMAWYFEPRPSAHLATLFAHGNGVTMAPYLNFTNNVAATS